MMDMRNKKERNELRLVINLLLAQQSNIEMALQAEEVIQLLNASDERDELEEQVAFYKREYQI
jgi:hypothetical protein